MATKLKYQVFDLEENKASLVSPETLRQGLESGRFKLKKGDTYLVKGAGGESYETTSDRLEAALAAGFTLEGSDSLRKKVKKERGILGRAKAVGGAALGELTLGATDVIREKVYGKEAVDQLSEVYKGEETLGTALGIGAGLLGSGVLGGAAKATSAATKGGKIARAIKAAPSSKVFKYSDEVGEAVEQMAKKAIGSKKGGDVMARAARLAVEGGVEEGARSVVENIARAVPFGEEEYQVEALVGDIITDSLTGAAFGGVVGGGMGLAGKALSRGGRKADDLASALRAGGDEIAEGAEGIGAGAARMGSGIAITADAASEGLEGVAVAAGKAAEGFDAAAGMLDDADEFLDEDAIAQLARDYAPDLTPDAALWRELDIQGKRGIEYQKDPELKAAMINEIRNAMNKVGDTSKVSSRTVLEASQQELENQGRIIGDVIEQAKGLERGEWRVGHLFDDIKRTINAKESSLAKKYGPRMLDYLDETYGTVAGDILDNAGKPLDYTVLAKKQFADLRKHGGKRLGDEGSAVMDRLIRDEGVHSVPALMDELSYAADDAADTISTLRASLRAQLNRAGSEQEKEALKAAFKRNADLIDAENTLEGIKQIRRAYKTATKDRSGLFKKLLSPEEIARRVADGETHAAILRKMGGGEGMLEIIEANGLGLDVVRGQSWRKVARELGEKGSEWQKEVDRLFYRRSTEAVKRTLKNESEELLRAYETATTRYRALNEVVDALDEKVAKFAGHRPLTMSKFFTGVGGATVGGALGPLGAAAGGLIGFAGGRIAQDRGGFWYARALEKAAESGMDIDKAVQKTVATLIKGADAARVGLRGAAKGARATAKIAGAASLGAKEIGKGANMIGASAKVLGKGVGKAARAGGSLGLRASGGGLKRAAIATRSKKAAKLIRVPILRLGHDDTTPEPMRRRIELREVMKNPERMAQIIEGRLGDLGRELPDFKANATKATMRALEYLDRIAPESFIDEFGMEKWRLMSEAEMASFMRSYHAALDPKSVIEDIRNGTLSFEAADALREVYPGIYEKFSVEITKAVQSGVYNPTHEDRKQLSILWNKDMGPTVSKDFVPYAQSFHGAKQEEQGGMQGIQPGRGANGFRLSGAKDFKLTTAKATGSNRLAEIEA